MKILMRLWSTLRESFWFLPSLFVAFSVVLALVLIEVDASGSRDWATDWPRLFAASAAGARGVLATIAGSMMTVVGVTFSMTLVTLALASSQYTSRILQNFMRDHSTQVVLGIFTGIFTYCLIVLRSIRGGDESGFVPILSVAFSVVLAIGGVGTLIFFIHHIAFSIQASSIIASVTRETLAAVNRIFPRELGRESVDILADQARHSQPMPNWQCVMATGNGYLQGVDAAVLLRLARNHKAIVRMDSGIGEFVVQDTPLVSIALNDTPNDEIIAALRSAYTIGRCRTMDYDCAFGIRQLVDMALRALSPGVNDATTAVMCVDHLTAILARLASREIPSSRRYEDGKLRVISIGQSFRGLVSESFDEIRGSAQGNVTIMLRMLDALRTIASMTASPIRRRVLRDQSESIAELAGRTIEAPRDRNRFEGRLSQLREAL